MAGLPLRARILVLVILAAALTATGAQAQRGRVGPDIAGKWSGTWTSFNPAQATDQVAGLCRQLNASVVVELGAWTATFEGDCGRPYRHKISLNGRLVGSVVMFTGTFDLGQEGGVFDWVGRAATGEFIGFYTSARATGFFNLKRAR